MRLINADELSKSIQITAERVEDNAGYGSCVFSTKEVLKHIEDAKTVPAVPLSVIEKIKAELTSKAPRHTDGTIARYSYGFSLDDVLEIIDQAIKECDT